jgi:hypothetical protein
MTEKGSPILLLIALGLLYWASLPSDPDPTQCDLMDTAPLIEKLATVKQSFTVEPEPTVEQSLPVQPIDPMPSPSDKPHEAVKREILVFLAPKDQKCEPCDRWKRCEMQRFMDAKWEVAIFDGPHNYGRTPTFELKSGDKKATLTGYTTLEQAAEAVR